MAGRLQSLARLDGYTAWEDLDWESLVNKIADLDSEESGSWPPPTSWRPSPRSCSGSGSRSATATQRWKICRSKRAVPSRSSWRPRRSWPGSTDILSDPRAAEIAAETFEAIEVLVASRLGQMATDTAAMTDTHQAVGSNLRDEQSKALSTQNRVGQRIIALMGEFRTSYPQETV